MLDKYLFLSYYDNEKREALEAWENELETVLAGKGKVIDIKEAKR